MRGIGLEDISKQNIMHSPVAVRMMNDRSPKRRRPWRDSS
jgi:hypothetical protein